MPKIEEGQNFYLPKLNPGQLKEMEIYLNQVLNSFVDFRVINPQYEYLMIKGRIKFNSSDTGLLFKQLYHELLNETCPWFFDDISTAFYKNLKEEAPATTGTRSKEDIAKAIKGLQYLADKGNENAIKAIKGLQYLLNK